MQDHYNLLAREEEREMIPLCLDEGVGTSSGPRWPAAAWPAPGTTRKSTARSETDGAYADMLYTPLTSRPTARSSTPSARGGRSPRRQARAGRAGLAARQAGGDRAAGRRRHHPQIDEAVASLDVELTDDELRTLQAPYTPRHDWQGISDEAELQAIRHRIPGMAFS